MKKVIIMLAAMVLLAAPAFGDYYGGRMSYGRIGGYYGGNGGEFTLSKDGIPQYLSNAAYANVAKAQNGDATSFQTFCVEGTEYVSQPMDLWVSTNFINEATGAITVPGSHAIKGGLKFGDNLDARTAFLYTKFATGTFSLIDYNYTAGAGRIASATALQNAIWFIEGEGGANNSLVTLANNAVAVGGEWYGKGIGDVRVLNTYTTGGALAQDQLYLVPAPAAIGLGLLGLALVGWVKRRLA